MYVFGGQKNEGEAQVADDDQTARRATTQRRTAIAAPTGAMLNQKIFAPYKIATLIDAVSAQGVAAEAVLARTGLTLNEVRDPHALTSVRQYLQACENTIAQGLDDRIAFTVGSRLHLSAYGMYGYALMCSPTMRDFFDFAVRYHLLATPTLRLGWRQEGNLAIWEFGELYNELVSVELRRFLMRQQMMQTATHVRDVAGPGIVPLLASFAVPESSSGGLDDQALGCACAFGRSANELHYPASILDQAPELGNRMTRILLEETCDRLIGEAIIRSGVAGEIYQILMLTPTRLPTIEEVSRKLGMTERTLRRRLSDEGGTYAQIIEDVRKKLTLEYLHTTRMSPDDIAWNVGFSDSANLRRAVKRWTGKTIGELRRS